MAVFDIICDSSDLITAKSIGQILESAGHTWKPREPGEPLALHAQEMDFVIAVFSTRFLDKSEENPEWTFYWHLDPVGRKMFLKPVVIEECNIQGLLGPIIPINLVGLAESDAKSVLLAGINPERKKPRTAPPLPPGMKQ